MKRIALLFILLSIIVSSISAKSYHMEITRQFTLQAGYDYASEIHVSPVVAQGQSYIAGMPFNIEDRQVQHGVTEQGREIARWDVLSNTDFNMKVSGTKLQHVNADTGTVDPADDDGLDYYLTFTYTIGYVDAAGNPKSFTGEREYHSAEPSTGIFGSLIPDHTADAEKNPFIGGVDGSIFFVFDEASSERIRSVDSGNPYSEAYLPAGDYMATVTVVLEQP